MCNRNLLILWFNNLLGRWWYEKRKIRKLFFVVICQNIKSAHLSLYVYRYRPLESSIYLFFFSLIWYFYLYGMQLYWCFLYYWLIGIFLLRSYKLIENLRFILEPRWFNKTFKLTKYKDSLSKNSCIITYSMNKYND